MRIVAAPFLLLIAVGTVSGLAQAQPLPAGERAARWSTESLARLSGALERAAEEAVGPAARDARALRAAIAAADPVASDRLADEAALRLLRAWAGEGARPAWWHLPAPRGGDWAARLDAALKAGSVGTLLDAARPDHPDYDVLATALASEHSPARRATLAANLQRWRWMPRDLGSRYILVNAAAMELSERRDDVPVARRRVIVGKPESQTPAFAATITGVILNPWWEIPSSIAAEGIAAMVKSRPAEAARRGYVFEGGRYRQKPGAGNALGRMKLVMPNPFSVYLHDTANRSLFARPDRALSHGCVRVDDAIGFVATLVGEAGWSRAQVEQAVATNRTRSVALAAPVPVYIAYFTAEPDGAGGVRFHRDIYGRDARPDSTARRIPTECSAAA